MANVWVVHAEKGSHTQSFIDGGYVAGGWLNDIDLSSMEGSGAIRKLYQENHPHLSAGSLTAYAGMLTKFLFEICPGDYVITPDLDRQWLPYGVLLDEPYFHAAIDADNCPFRHRRKVSWEGRLQRKTLPVPFQDTLKAAKTLFFVSHGDEFFRRIGQLPPEEPREPTNRVILRHILNLTAEEFEELVTHLLAAMGFDSNKVGKPGDGGVDVQGILNVDGLAQINLFVQAKRYKNRRVDASAVKKLQRKIPPGGYGAVVTTSDFASDARDAASEPGLPPVGLINGHQLVDLLIKHWGRIDPDFRDALQLEQGLVPK